MNIEQLKLSPVMPDHRPPLFEKIECNGLELFAVLAQINARGDRVASMNVDRAHYTLNVQRKSKP